MNSNFDEIKRASEQYLPQMTKFLRDLISIPSESCEEEGVIRRTIAEMEALGFDKAEIDPEGNALGWMGTGEKIIAFDGHIDTVGIGNRATGNMTLMRAMRRTRSSTAAAVRIRKAAWWLPFTARRS